MTEQDYSNRYAILVEYVENNEKEYSFLKGIIDSFPNNPWYLNFDLALREFQGEKFGDISKINVNSPSENRIFQKDGMKYYLWKLSEIKEKLYSEGKNEIFDNNLPVI
jgi:hypothetical protein